jgi:hypothetical protein
VIEGPYEMFGMGYHTDPVPATLQGSGIQVLSDGNNAGEDLQKLIRSLLVAYIELVQGTALGETGLNEARLSAIETMLLNMHFIVNSYRPQVLCFYP